MTLEEAKDQIARRYTGGKHGWYSDYLTPHIKVLLMDDVAKIYAESQLAKYREVLERLLEENMCSHAGDELIEKALKTGGKQ